MPTPALRHCAAVLNEEVPIAGKQEKMTARRFLNLLIAEDPDSRARWREELERAEGVILNCNLSRWLHERNGRTRNREIVGLR